MLFGWMDLEMGTDEEEKEEREETFLTLQSCEQHMFCISSRFLHFNSLTRMNLHHYHLGASSNPTGIFMKYIYLSPRIGYSVIPDFEFNSKLENMKGSSLNGLRDIFNWHLSDI